MSKRLIVNHKDHHFPDRIRRAGAGAKPTILPESAVQNSRPEAEFRKARCLLMSLWMHSVFCDFSPHEWKSDLMAALDEVGLQESRDWIDKAKVDTWANDWGDQSAQPGRPVYRDWTTISLYPGASQPLGGRERELQSVGSAIVLSSIPLRPQYIATVRPWIRSVYGLLLGVDAAIKTHNQNVQNTRKVAQELALVAGPWIAHEITNIFKLTFSRVSYEMESVDPDAVQLRKQAWDTLRVIAQLSDLVGKAVTRGSIKKEMAVIRRRFVEPLVKELERGPNRLIRSVYTVSRQVYLNTPGNSEIRDLANLSLDAPVTSGIEPAVYGVCLLLVHEIITNFRTHTKIADPDARFVVQMVTSRPPGKVEERLRITLESKSEDKEYESEAFNLLHLFLQTAEVGKAVTKWDEERNRYEYLVEILVRERGPSSHEETTISAHAEDQ